MVGEIPIAGLSRFSFYGHKEYHSHMPMSLIKSDYPTITEQDYQKICKEISRKCNEYYFLDFLKCTEGDVDDAIDLFYFDEKLRTILLKYIMRFEIQIKCDFAEMIENATGSTSFWADSSFYYLDFLIPDRKGITRFQTTKENVQSCIDRMNFRTIRNLNCAAMYAASFGSFVTLFRGIDYCYKSNFINRYTSHLGIKTNKVLSLYFSAIKAIRNRCAHGNHVATGKMKNELYSFLSLVNSSSVSPKPGIYISVFEAVLLFLIKQSNCGNLLKGELQRLFSVYKDILKRYGRKISLFEDTIAKFS